MEYVQIWGYRYIVINVGGWLLISLLLTILLIIVQRAERNRRVFTAVVMSGAAYLVIAYGVYRLSRECDQFIRGVCNLPQLRDQATLYAYQTINLAALTALILAFLFWLFVGRYNPPGSSESIRVLGLND